jgi:polyprenyl-phospho-N-acetylgalactosaminyl synthase
MKEQNIWIVIAAYNESRRISQVVKSLIQNGYNNIVITDDGSQDNTYEIISKLPVHALKHIINRGQGASLRTGIEYALENDADIIVTFDADGQHMANEIQRLIIPINEKKCDVSLGSRFLNKRSRIPFMRKVLLKGSVFVIFLFYGARMTDAHNGLRAISRNAAKKIQIRSDRMEHASEIIDEIVKKKIKYKEISVTINYNDDVLQKGAGSFTEAIKVLFKMIWRKLMN